MSKYVSVKKLEDGKTEIVITKIPESNRNGYSIFFEGYNDASDFFDIANMYYEKKIGVKSRSELVKAGSMLFIVFAKDVNPETAKYTVVLNNTRWVKKHIERIKSQLIAQANQIEQDVATKKLNNAINEAVKTNNSANLIKTMLRKSSKNFSDEDLQNIQDCLDNVKQQKESNT
ncbi:MAG: hypothetical protein IJ358_03165, partial [Clostridia bacterium]|nr:hypothetical protein [Clostridia bacterium]